MQKRREFLKTSAAGLMGLGALSSLSSLTALQAGEQAASAVPSPHFIFMHNGNGTFPSFLTPLSLGGGKTKANDDKTKEEAVDLDLTKLELQEWMAPLNPYKKNMTLLQGMSAQMCSMGHFGAQGIMCLCKASERPATIARASIDVELGRMFPSPFQHIELTCAFGRKGIVNGLSAIGPKQPNIAFASPSAAINNLFRIGSEDKAVVADVQMENDMYSFLSNMTQEKGRNLSAIEGELKIGNYVTSIDGLLERNKKLKSISDRIRKFTPKISDNVMKDEYTTVEQLDAFADIVVGAMGAGLSNSITLTLDTLDTRISGLIENDFHLHTIGHGGAVEGHDALVVREMLRKRHVKVIDTIIKGLKNIPEGKGNMFDNTIIMYFPENGEAHHSTGIEEPFIILAGNNAKLNLFGRYIRVPGKSDPAHKTIGNFYTTLFNAYGNPIKHFGDLDMGIKYDQKGPIKQLMV